MPFELVPLLVLRLTVTVMENCDFPHRGYKGFFKNGEKTEKKMFLCTLSPSVCGRE